MSESISGEAMRFPIQIVALQFTPESFMSREEHCGTDIFKGTSRKASKR